MLLVFFQTYLIDSYLRATYTHDGQSGLGASAAGCKHSLILLPLVAFGTDGGLGQGIILLINQLDNQQLAPFGTLLFLDSRQIAQTYREIVLGTINHIDTIETLVIDGVAADNGITRIIITNRIDMYHHYRLGCTPSGGGIGAAFNLGFQFKIAISDKLCFLSLNRLTTQR